MEDDAVELLLHFVSSRLHFRQQQQQQQIELHAAAIEAYYPVLLGLMIFPQFSNKSVAKCGMWRAGAHILAMIRGTGTVLSALVHCFSASQNGVAQ